MSFQLKNKRFVRRPFNNSRNPTWNDILPSGILFDTHPKNILEICGMNENNQKFHTRKN